MAKIFLFEFCLGLFVMPVFADWSDNPAENTAVCLATGQQTLPQTISDGEDGAIIVWLDERNGNRDIFCQRIAANGNVVWAENGIAVTEIDGAQSEFAIVSDGANGVIIVWCDQRGGISGDIYGQRIGPSGEILWEQHGKSIALAPRYQGSPDICATGNGEQFVVAWLDRRNNLNSDEIYCQKINLNGDKIWEDGVYIAPEDTLPSPPRVIGNHSGGAFVSWYEIHKLPDPSRLYQGTGVYLQKLAADGSSAWLPERLNLIFYAEDQPQMKFHCLKRSASDCVCIFWTEYLASDLLCLSKVDSNKNILFNTYYGGPDRVEAFIVKLASSEEAYIFYNDWTEEESVILAKVKANGDWDWSKYFAGNFPETSSRLAVMDAAVFNDNSIITFWADSILKAQRYSSLEEKMWSPEYVKVSVDANSATAVTDSSFGTIVAFERDGDIYAQRISGEGILGGAVVPVEMAIFKATAKNDHILFEWTTYSECNCAGFEILQRMSNAAENASWQCIGYVAGHGTISTPNTYRFVGQYPEQPGKYYFILKQLDQSGAFHFSNEIALLIQPPAAFSLAQNFPNPFNASTIITFQLPQDGYVTLKIYDLLGRMIEQPLGTKLRAGHHRFVYDGTKLASGIYFYELATQDFIDVKKMVLLE